MFKSFAGRIANVRISFKVFVAPVAIMMFMLAMAAVSQYGANQQSKALSRFNNETLPKSVAVTHAADLALLAHVNLYRTVNWAANSQQADKVDASSKAATEVLRLVKEELAAIGERWSSTAEDAALRKAAVDALEKYTDAATNVLDMASSDAATAFVFLLQVEKPFDALRDNLEALREVQSRQSEDSRAAAARGEAQARLLFLTLLGAALILAAVVTWVVARMISRPITGMTAAMTALARGDHSVTIPGTGRKDEIGRMAESVQVFKTNMIETERLRAEQAELEKRAERDRKAAMQKFAGEFEKTVGEIVHTVSSASTQLEAAAGTLTKTAEATQQLSGSVAAASEQASANVQSVASATEEMTSSVHEISRQVQESTEFADRAVKQAQQTNQQIADLSQAAGRIGDVIKLITAIAEQTNLLALNATIEAARAGEAGRGFAVVAQEVKALAAQTAKATGDIGSQIGGIQNATQESVAAIKEIGTTIGKISTISTSVAAAIEEQSAATQEIARNVHQAAQGTAEVAGNITSVNRGASETGSASAQVLASAQSLSKESNRLKLEVDKFLAMVRAA